LRRDPTIITHHGQGSEIRVISVEEAQERMLAQVSPLEAETVELSHACGRVLAQAQFSRVALPQFDNSSMDGFAVRYEDVAGANPNNPIELTVVGDAPAGQVFAGGLEARQAVRIMTGAPLPEGADAVIPVEHTDFDGRTSGIPSPAFVKVYQAERRFQYIRPRGQDVQEGELALDAGKPLRPQEVGFLASMGIARVPVSRRPRVALFSTGDELVPVSAPLSAGKIYESNSYVLAALIEKYRGDVLFLGIIPDQEMAVRECLLQAVSRKADLIISSAGVSVGAMDFVRSVMEAEGKLEFWRVNMRPGKPVAFGEFQGIPFIGLPGNPVSAYVGAELFVRPVLCKMTGLSSWMRPYLTVKVLEEIESDGRESYFRAWIENKAGVWVASLRGHQGSGNLRSLVQANALLLVPSGVKSLPIGSEARAYVMEDI
jgi:molybdopterin molybdotransferase